ncbi:MAG: peptide ABC transporter substrate-binding protein [Chloroflexota bacterium]
MARRIRWQILIASISSILVLGLISYLALTTAAIARPLSGGVYIEGLLAPPQSLNPLVSNPAQDQTSADLQALLFDGLMRTGPSGFAEPALAQSLPEISEDGTVYTFSLRQDVVWHDGTPFTADDVIFTMRSVQSPAFAGNPATAELWRNVLIDKVDDHTIRITLTSPAAPFLNLATFPIVPSHILGDMQTQEWSTTTFNREPIGTGPYQISEITSEHVLLEANPAYYEDRPFLDSVEFRFFSSYQEATAALVRGEINSLGFLTTNEQYRVAPPPGSIRPEILLDTYTILTFNLRNDLLADEQLRQALATGLDKDVLIEQTLDSRVSRIDTPILPGWWVADAELSWYAASQTAAADALDASGYALDTNGVRVRGENALEFLLITDGVPERVAVAQEISRQWGELGIRVEIEQLDSATLEQRLQERDFEMALHGWQRLGPDPDVTFAQWHSSNAATGFNYAGLEDEQIDEALLNGRRDGQIPARLSWYTAFQERWVELVPSITLYQQRYTYTVPTDLGGLSFTQTPDTSTELAVPQLLFGREDRLRNASQWFLQGEREIRGNLR